MSFEQRRLRLRLNFPHPPDRPGAHARSNVIMLYSFVGIDSYVVSISLFRRFLRFYADQGVDAFVFDFQTNDNDREGRLPAFSAVVREFDGRISHIVREPYRAHENQVAYTNSFIRQFADGRQWCLLADSDEFIDLPDGAAAFLDRCDKSNADIVVGDLLDRFSAEGFPEITDNERLDDLFPLGYPLTRRIREGCDRKVVAVKKRCTVVPGRHAVEEEGGVGVAVRETEFLALLDEVEDGATRSVLRDVYPFLEPDLVGLRKWQGRVDVHHFAWDAGVFKKMEARTREPDCEYLDEVQNVLAFVRDPDYSRLLPYLMRRDRLGV